MDQYAFAKDSNVFSASVESLRARGIPLIVENIKKEYYERIGDAPNPTPAEDTVVVEDVVEATETVVEPKKKSKKK